MILHVVRIYVQFQEVKEERSDFSFCCMNLAFVQPCNTIVIVVSLGFPGTLNQQLIIFHSGQQYCLCIVFIAYVFKTCGCIQLFMVWRSGTNLFSFLVAMITCFASVDLLLLASSPIYPHLGFRHLVKSKLVISMLFCSKQLYSWMAWDYLKLKLDSGSCCLPIEDFSVCIVYCDWHCYLWWRWCSGTLWMTLTSLWLHSLSFYFESVVMEISLPSHWCIYLLWSLQVP
jgi:hypothetical protein